MSRYIDADKMYIRTAELEAAALAQVKMLRDDDRTGWMTASAILNERTAFKHDLMDAQTAEVMTYTEIAEMLNDLFGDSCPCNYKGIDEWLPFECKFEECHPQPWETRCWEEYLRHRKGGE